MQTRTVPKEVDATFKQIDNATDTIRQLVLQNQQLRHKHREEVQHLRQQVDHLEGDLSSMTAQNQRLKSQLERSRQMHEQFNRRSAEQIRQLKIMLKAREKDNYNKDVAIASHDRTLSQLTIRQTQLNKQAAQARSTVQKLGQAYKQQQQEILEQQTFISTLISYIQQFQHQHNLFFQHRSLYQEYRQELQSQINQVECVNEKLLMRTANYVQLQQQLISQNTQNNDLVNLSQNMLQTLEAQCV